MRPTQRAEGKMGSDAHPKRDTECQQLFAFSAATPSAIFKRIRNYLAGRHVGATRDRALLDQLLLCLFARLQLGRESTSDAPPRPAGLAARYRAAAARVRDMLGSECLPETQLDLDELSLSYVDECLAELDVEATSGDLVGDAYQCFHGADSRGQDGQFFTPAAAVKILVGAVDPRPGERIIDPAAGTGTFLFAAAHHLSSRSASPTQLADSLFAVEKDAFLARLARMRLSFSTRRPSHVSLGDSLAWRSPEPASFMTTLPPGSYDVVLTNPPFGAKIVSASDETRRMFTLAHRWVRAAPDRPLTPTTQPLRSTPPQVLFVERCVSLVRPGGRIGMVVPESLVSGRSYGHVIEFLLQHTAVEAVVGMPEALFKTSGKGGTHTKTVLLVLRRHATRTARPCSFVFMAEAAWCGHDSRGRPIPRDETDTVLANLLACRTSPATSTSRLGFAVGSTSLKRNTLAPRAYDPSVAELLSSLASSHALLRFGDLVREGAISLSTGDEVGKLAYGTGSIPFVRTSDLANWELKVDPKHGVSRSVYMSVREKQDVQAGDILMVRDGTYLIGTCAMVTKYDTEIVLQSHILKIRLHHHPLLDPYLLLAVLSSDPVQRQIRAHSQTQDIINSLGNRIHEIILPVPKEAEARVDIAQLVQRVIHDRSEARELAREVMDRRGPPESQSRYLLTSSPHSTFSRLR